MDVTIFYCELCRLREPAERIADALQSEFGLSTEIRKGVWGTLRIEYQGVSIFNRWKDRGWIGRLGFGRTPTPEEIVALLRDHLAEKDSPATDSV